MSRRKSREKTFIRMSHKIMRLLLDYCPEKMNAQDIRSMLNLKRGQIGYCYRAFREHMPFVKKTIHFSNIDYRHHILYYIDEKDRDKAYEAMFSSEKYRS